MKQSKFAKVGVFAAILLLSVAAAFAQQGGKTAAQKKAKPVIFAVTDDGKSLEPIGAVDKGELVATVGGGDDVKAVSGFAASYYKPQTVYKLIFGGASNGTVTVKSSNPKAECGKNLATVVTVSPKAKLKGLVMGLATNAATLKTSGVRRLPTAAERTEIENLVRGEFTKQAVSAAALKNLHYYNLTALDVDGDGKPELVGSYWTETSAKERNQLFFIAEKNAAGKYDFGYSNYQKLPLADVMSGDFKDVDNGVDSELLLDSFEYNGDKTDEIFTITQGFEGNSFAVYSRQNGKWTKVFDGSNYHCAY